MPRVDVNGVSINYAVEGEGEPLLLIPYLAADHACYAFQLPEYTAQFQCISVDLPGSGESDKPARGYSLAHHGEDLEGLLDHFGLRKAVLIGHSLGAHIALRFAATRPARVSKLVLVDGGLDVRAEVLDSLRPAINRLGVEFPSLDAFLGFIRMLPMFEGRWNDYLERYFRYDVEALPGGAVRSKAARHAIASLEGRDPASS